MNKKNLVTLINSIILVSILTVSFTGTVIASPYLNINVQRVRRMVLRNCSSNLVILDLRSESMYMSGHIPGAINVPVLPPPPDWTVLENWINSDEGQSHLNDKIIVHCLAGLASPSAANMLETAGFTRVYNMEGGFNAWIAAGYNIEIAVTHSGVGISSSPPTDSWSIGGDPPKFTIWKGSTVTIATLTLTIHSNPAEILVGSGYSEICGITQFTETGSIVYHLANGVWTFPGGTFEGKYVYIVTKPTPSPFTWTFRMIRCVLYGTGDFEGQKLLMSYDGPMIGASWTGFLYKSP